MKHVKLLVAIALLFIAAGSVSAQTSPKADKLIKESQAKFNAVKDITADFIYTISNPNLEESIVKKGKIVLSKNKYHITFPDEELICNGKFVWIVLHEEEEVTKSNFDPEENLSPQKMYSIYEKDTKSRYDGNVEGVDQITLFANSEKGDIFKTELWIKKDRIIEKAIMHARNGSKYEYRMSSVKIDSGVDASVFQLNEKAYQDKDYIFTDLTSEQ